MERIVELLKATCMVSRILKHHVCISTCMYYALNTQRKLGQLINISEFFMRSKLMRSPLKDICNQKFHAFFSISFNKTEKNFGQQQHAHGPRERSLIMFDFRVLRQIQNASQKSDVIRKKSSDMVLIRQVGRKSSDVINGRSPMHCNVLTHHLKVNQ